MASENYPRHCLYPMPDRTEPPIFCGAPCIDGEWFCIDHHPAAIAGAAREREAILAITGKVMEVAERLGNDNAFAAAAAIENRIRYRSEVERDGD